MTAPLDSSAFAHGSGNFPQFQDCQIDSITGRFLALGRLVFVLGLPVLGWLITGADYRCIPELGHRHHGAIARSEKFWCKESRRLLVF
ncbi:hypothetical protein [Limnothrix redekei]|uniref:Uncharacterized protein n=1 Tax=Limnothrix redekei LRLZ20PSL1 TaxID=3112953 RepID=A0ABW7CDT7_9CYAN